MSTVVRVGAVAALLCGVGLHADVTRAADRSKPTATVLVPGQSHGVIMRRMNGVAFNPADKMLYATTTASEAVYRINPKTGDVVMAVEPPWGEGDDIAAAPDGGLAWTAIATGQLYYKRPNGKTEVLDKDVPGINPVAFDKNGRLVAAQANQGHALYEFDPTGRKAKRLIMKDMADLNSFGFGPNGLLYSPQRPDKLVEIDIDKSTLRVIADNMGGATRVEADGHVISISRDHDLMRVDPATGKMDVIAHLGPGTDGIAIGDDGTIYTSTPSESTIRAVDPKTGAIRDVVRGRFSSLAGIAMIEKDGREILFATDAWGFRDVDPVSGVVTKVPTRGLRAGGSSDIAVSDDAIAISNVRVGLVQKLDRATEKMQFENTTIKTPYGVALLDDGAVAVDHELPDTALEIGLGAPLEGDPVRSPRHGSEHGPVGGPRPIGRLPGPHIFGEGLGRPPVGQQRELRRDLGTRADGRRRPIAVPGAPRIEGLQRVAGPGKA